MTNVLAALVLAILSAGDDWPQMTRLYGDAGMTAFTGNGGLTVGIDERGRISVCRWPTPSFHDQLEYTVSAGEREGTAPLHHGLKWGVSSVAGIAWFGSGPWTGAHGFALPQSNVLVSVAQDAVSAARLTQTIFTDPERDVMVCHLRVDGFPAAPTLYWHANFAPSTRKLPGLPVADWGPLDHLNDFAAFSGDDGRRMYHFRPLAPSTADWKRAEEWVSEPPPPDAWRDFGEGVWIAYAATSRVLTSHCGAGDTSPELVAERFLEPGAGSVAATGRTYSAMRILPREVRDGHETAVFIAFGGTMSEVNRMLDGALEEGAEALRARAFAADESWLEQADMPIQEDFELTMLMQRALLMIHAATDRQTGATVRSPAAQPPLARDWPRHGAWVTEAYSTAGFNREAERRSLFYLDHIRRERGMGRPLGSLPAALYTDGIEAAPEAILDTVAVARTLWSIYRHGQRLSGEIRRAYYQAAWEGVELAADFLAGWADSQGRPLHSHDPVLMHDTRRRTLLVANHEGIVALLGIARELGIEPPAGWSRSKVSLDILLQNLFLLETLEWPLDTPLPTSLTAIPNVDEQDINRLLGEYIAERLDGLEGMDGYTAAATLANVAMVWRNQARQLESLHPYLTEVLRKACETGGVRGPDTAAAAMAYVAADLVLRARNELTSPPQH